MISIEARILQKMREPFAAGIYEDRNAPFILKYARSILRYYQSLTPQDLPVSGDNALFPGGECNVWRLGKPAAFFYNYSFSVSLDANLFKEKIDKYLTSSQEISIAQTIMSDLTNFTFNPMSRKYVVGGSGYTHSILNYRKLLQQGLPGYLKEIENGLARVDSTEKSDFYAAMHETLAALLLFLDKAIEAVPAGKLKTALATAKDRPPKTFYEAMVLLNLVFYIDGCDSVGALDVCLTPFFDGSNPEKVLKLLEQFYGNVDANTGWHMILGGRDANKKLTELCLRAVRVRRPNTGLKISAATPDAVWDAAFDCLQRNTGNPSLYNDTAYRAAAAKLTTITPADMDDIAYGGCTEFMVDGKSNVGSIDSGINLLEILEASLAYLPQTMSFNDFMQKFKQDIRNEVKRVARETDLNQEYKALYRPQLIRSLFIDDCLANGIEYNAGGARYNGGVINVAGLANAANSLFVIKEIFAGTLDIDGKRLLEILANNYQDHEELRLKFLQLPKFGNNCPEVDMLAKKISDVAFGEIIKYRCRRGNGFYLPSIIMFVTYINEGLNIGATPDGRRCGSPIADSCGPMQGTDLEGPTSMLQSAAALPQAKGLGTLVLNLRVRSEMVSKPSLRRKLKNLIEGYFKLGGLQVQITVLDAETLKNAMEHPEQYRDLVIRVGGYTEYFHRLDDCLLQEVIKRHEYT